MKMTRSTQRPLLACQRSYRYDIRDAVTFPVGSRSIRQSVTVGTAHSSQARVRCALIHATKCTPSSLSTTRGAHSPLYLFCTYMSARCVGSTMSITKDLSKCTPEEVKKFLNSFDIMLSDCDGVLWHIDGQLGGVAESLNRLHGMKKDVYLVTNNSTYTLQEQCNLLRKRGVEIKEELIINTAKVIVWYLQKINFQGDVYAIGSPTFTKYFTEAGMRLTPYPVLEKNNVSKTIREIRDRPSVKAVVIDFDVECNWSKLALALSCLMRDDVLYVTGAMDDWGTSSDAIRILGPGPLTRVVTNQSGREPIECAKPSGVLKDYIYEICKVTDPRRCLFVGDTVNQDMKFGRMCEFQKLFVGTGCDKLEDAQKMPDTSPEYFIPSFGDLHSVIDRLSHE